MIVLDTNVLSETQKIDPNTNVMDFLDSLDPTITYITTITVAEILYGIDIMPLGNRKTQLESAAFNLFNNVFKGRVLGFDFDAASHYAIRAAIAKREGKAVAFADGQIASIAISKSARIATRDTSPFEAMGASVVNPWLPQEKRRWTIL